MKRNLLKTSLVTLGLVWGMGSAFAQEQATLYSLNFDNLSETPTDWEITAGTLSLETDGTNKFLKQSTSGTGSRGAWYTGSAISSAVANVDNWTISFDCLIAEGTNTGNYSQGVWILGSDLSNTWGAPTTPLAGVVKGSNADSYTLQVNGAEAETGIQLTSNQYYHYTYSYDKTTKILSVTIQDTENTVVYEKNDISYDYETSTIGDLTSIFIQAGRNSSGSASETNGFTCIDNILLTTKSNQEIVAAPLASVTAINGVSRTITITPQDASHTVFYYIGEDSSNPTEYTEPVVISETGTLHYYAQSASGATSTVQSLEVNCVEVVLAAPTFLRTGADSYEITATQSATDGLTPVATIHYTIAGGEEQTIASGSKISGVNGDITAWAVAEGYTNSEVVTETYVAPYETEDVWSYDLNSFPSTYSITAIADAIDESTETTLNELTVYNLVNIERPDLYVENSEGWLLRNQARNAFKIQNSATSITFNNVAPGNLIYINGVDDNGRNRITNIVNGEVAYSFNNSEFFIVPNTAGAVSVTFNTGVSINEVAVRTIIGGETPQGETATFDFNANEWGLPVGDEGNIGDRTIESGGVVASFTDGGTPTRMWGDAPNTHVRIYAENANVDDDVNGTMTLTAPDGKVITKVEFDATGSNYFNFTVTDGTLEGTTWTGNASAVTFTTENGQTRLNKVVVTVEDIPIPEVQNLAALKAMEETGTEVKLILNDTKITVMEQSFLMPVILIEDASGAAVQIPAAMGMGDGIATMFPEQFAKAGVALNGYLYCAYDPSMGGTIMPSENTANSEFTATDTEVTPTVMTIAEASTDANANRYIQLQNVEINESYEIVDGESSILMQDLLGAMTDMTTYETVIPEGKININGFIMTMDPGSYWFVPVGNPPYTEIVEKPEPSDLRVWDFTKWSDATVDNLEAEAVNHTDEPAPQGEETGWRRYEKDGDPWEGENGLKDARTIYWYGNLISEPTELKANGETIEETAGLLFNNVTNLNNTVAIAIDYPSAVSDYDGGAYLWLNGADLQFTIQSVLPGQKVLMEVESHRDGSGRGVSLSVNGTAVGESAEPSDGKVSYEWTIPAELGTEPVDVLVTSTNGCHIYRLEVGNADLISVGINEVNAENGVQNDNVYTINGVMVRKAGESLDGLAKGLYIIGGKKVVIK